MRSKQEILKELPTPYEFDNKEEPKVFSLIYKAIWCVLEVCLDIRSNTNPNKDKKQTKNTHKKVDNPVIPKNLELK